MTVRWVSALLLLIAVAGRAAPASTTVVLQSGTPSSVVGQPVKLTATVTPSNATGKVTFFDGVSVIGAATLSGGQAVFSTAGLASGTRFLRAYYLGDSNNPAVDSPLVLQTVTALAQRGFSVPFGYATPFGGVESIGVGDFNGDGIPDLAVAGNSGFPVFLSQVIIFLAFPDGTFRSGYAAGLSGAPHAVAVADFNADGYPDLAIATASTISILLGHGDGTFVKGITRDLGDSAALPVSLATGDFNGDGIADLAWGGTIGASTSAVGVLLGTGDGTFQAAVNLTAGSSPNFIAIGDFNGDGRADLAVTNGGVSILVGNGDGTLRPPVNFSTGHPTATALAVADLNGDARADIVVANGAANSVSVLAGNGDGTFRSPADYTVLGGPVTVVAADFTGDGRPDLVTGNPSTGVLSILNGNGDGTFQAAISYSAGTFPNSLLVADFNRDGRQDVAIAANNAAGIVVALGAPLPLTPVIQNGGVLNGASLQPGISPGAWVTILGSSFSTITDTWNQSIVNGALPSSLDSVKVTIGGKPAYVAYIGAGQINVLAPDIGTGNVQVTVSGPNGNSIAAVATSQAYSPAFFLWNGVYAVATHADFTLAAKAGLFPGLTTVPAKPGETVILWATGFGAANPAVPTGTVTPPDQTYFTAAPVTATVGGSNATVLYAVLAPGFAGLYQIAVQIPASIGDGDAVVRVSIGGILSPEGVKLTVQR